MVHTNALTLAAAAAFLAAAPVNAGLYPRGSQVTSIAGKDFDRVVKQSNYTSVSTLNSSAPEPFYTPHTTNNML